MEAEWPGSGSVEDCRLDSTGGTSGSIGSGDVKRQDVTRMVTRSVSRHRS